MVAKSQAMKLAVLEVSLPTPLIKANSGGSRETFPFHGDDTIRKERQDTVLLDLWTAGHPKHLLG